MLLEDKRRLVKNEDILFYETAFAALRFLNKRFSSKKATLKCIKCEKSYKNENC